MPTARSASWACAFDFTVGGNMSDPRRSWEVSGQEVSVSEVGLKLEFLAIFGDFRRFSAICMGPRHTNICMGPRQSEMSDPRRSV